MNKTKQITDEKEIVANILSDYNSRAIEKRPYVDQWLLNLNFLRGNQYVYVSNSGKLKEEGKVYPYESKEVFNHIAPIIESRLAKLEKVRPSIAVRPSSTSEADRATATLSKKVLDSVFDDIAISSILKNASVWSEVAGSVFYKVGFDKNYSTVGLNIDVISPFEIFPESASYQEIDDNPSIIHAKYIDVNVAKELYNLPDIVGEEVTEFSFDNLTASLSAGYDDGASFLKSAVGVKTNRVLVIEKYTKPTIALPNGKLEIVVANRLVYSGDLPFGEYPFIKQVSGLNLGSFWGVSVIERCIPVQRAYNAVKNRKLEYLSRLSSGVLAVEEGSVDLDELESEGLAPGKILVYRNGSTRPTFMDGFSIPPEFNREEERLLDELNVLAGVSDLMRSSVLPSNVTSGKAISELAGADDTRLSVTAEHIRNSLLLLAKLSLRVIKQMVKGETLSKISDNKGNVEVFYWSASSLKAEDIVLDTLNELSDNLTGRRATAMELFKLGIFLNKDGKMDDRTRVKFLEIMGLGNFESGQDIAESHINRAKAENITEKDLVVLEIDDHELHIAEHTRYILENDLTEDRVKKLLEHIRMHKTMEKVGEAISKGGGENQLINNINS